MEEQLVAPTAAGGELPVPAPDLRAGRARGAEQIRHSPLLESSSRDGLGDIISYKT